MADITWLPADLTSFLGLDELGLVAERQRVAAEGALVLCRVVGCEADRFCPRCGAEGRARDTVTRRLSHLPLGWRPTLLVVRIRRFRCAACRHVWQEDTSRMAEARAKLSRTAVVWALIALVVHHMTVNSVAKSLKVSWRTANKAILAEARRTLFSDPARFDGVAVIGVDEHKWCHYSRKNPDRENYVTVIIDLTPVQDRTGPARLLDVVEGRSKAVFAEWMEARPKEWRDKVEVVAMDGFTGYKSAVDEELPDAVVVMDPFHVVRLVGDALDECRRRIQQATLGRRGRKGDPLYKARRALLTSAEWLTKRQVELVAAVVGEYEHTPVAVTWFFYQEVITAYNEHRDSGRRRGAGRETMAQAIDKIATGVPDGLEELRKLGGTLKKRADDILAYFDNPHTSNGPTEAINGRLEHLRGTALGFRNITNYIARCLLESGGFRTKFV